MRSFHLRMSLASALGVFASAGCIAPTVIGGDSGGGASGGGGGDPGPTTNALALRYDEFPTDGGGSGSSSVGGGAKPDPATLFLEIDSGAITCGDPDGFGANFGSPCTTGWHVSIGLPPAYQAVGIYDLSDQTLLAFFSMSENDGKGSCSGGGGSFLEGTLEIVSIDGQKVVVRLQDTGWIKGADGEYVVPRCSPVAPPPADGIAIRADQIPPADGGGSTSGSSGSGGGGLDPAMLFVMVGDHAIACAAPYASNCGVDEWAVSVGLPVAYQTPGIYSLSDPEVISTFSETLASPSGGCSGGGGTFWDGSIEVLSIDASGLNVRFIDVTDFADELEKPRFVPRCP